MTTIATWNLHHMGNEVGIPWEVVAVIERVRPDVLVLTEYVDRGGRADFVAALARIGYRNPRHSEAGKEPRQNQVLVASLHEQEDGSLEAPKVDEAARTNFLHQRLPGPGLELDLIGFRAPHYQSEKPVNPKKLVDYWWQFKKMALGEVNRRVVFIGDFNIGTKDVDVPGREAIASLVRKGFRLVGEEGGLDRALLSPVARLKSFSVIEAIGDQWLTGEGGLSDHPMLVVEVA
jgi:exonuclease III